MQRAIRPTPFHAHHGFSMLLAPPPAIFRFSGKEGTGRRALGQLLSPDVLCFTLEVSFYASVREGVGLVPYTRRGYVELGRWRNHATPRHALLHVDRFGRFHISHASRHAAHQKQYLRRVIRSCPSTRSSPGFAVYGSPKSLPRSSFGFPLSSVVLLKTVTNPGAARCLGCAIPCMACLNPNRYLL